MENDLFIRACRQEPVERTPVWIMRQAGRILPPYRKIRESLSFEELMRSPQKVAEVTKQPVDMLGVDAAILFTDILVIPEAMGMELEYKKGVGPVFADPVQSGAAIDALSETDPKKDLSYVLEGIEATLELLQGAVPLIGFAGSPWTLACYMIEGGSSKRYKTIRRMMYSRPKLLKNLLASVTEQVTKYLNAKIECGVDAVQVFDTSGGILPPDLYKEFSMQWIQKIGESLPEETPFIYFGKGTGFALESIVETDPDVVGVDWTVRMDEARETAGDRCAVQGNLDPAALYGSKHRIEVAVEKTLQDYGSHPGHIFNLGHGVYPDTDLENVQHFVACVKEKSRAFHE